MEQEAVPAAPTGGSWEGPAPGPRPHHHTHVILETPPPHRDEMLRSACVWGGEGRGVEVA